MGTTEYKQVAFMPWAGLQREIAIGEVRFWPFHSQKERLILDEEIRSYLERYFSRHVDHEGRPVKTVTVASIGEVSFEPLDDIARRRIRQAADALLFASVLPGVKAGVCANNQSWPQLNADTFQLVFQSFEPGSDHIAVQSGPALSGGWRLDQITFPMPWTARTSPADPEKELLGSLGAVLDPHFDGAKRQRVFRALEWFRLSHTDLDEVSDPNRLVMMATAFEIVLQFPRWSGKKKEFFVDQIQRIVAGGRLDAPSSNLSIVAGKWAGDFYKLRGDIVHGDPVSSQDLIYREWITHLVVVDLIFWECLVLLLVQWGVYQTGAEEVIEEWSKAAREHLTHVFLGFDNIHRALGWLPPL